MARKLKHCLFLVFIGCLYLISINFFKESPFSSSFNNELQNSKLPKPINLKTDSKPLILLWSSYFQQDWVEAGHRIDCIKDKCSLVSARVYLQYADIVLFHWKDTKYEDLPKLRPSFNQIWTLYNMESPSNTGYLIGSLQAMQSEINWTMGYRRDSDVWTPYGYFINQTSENYLKSINFKSKKHEIAWFVSNCDTPGRREVYVKELSKYVEVHIYGVCGPFTCSRNNQKECYELIQRDYKFYLSFENSICKDYVTEKLFRVMEYDVIPIVFGGANYSAILPAQSYIDALSFQNPFELSKYLRIVSSNETLYSSYFKWRKNYKLIDSISNGLCFLCEKILNERQSHTQSTRRNKNLVNWWFDDSKCKSWTNKSLSYSLSEKLNQLFKLIQ